MVHCPQLWLWVLMDHNLQSSRRRAGGGGGILTCERCIPHGVEPGDQIPRAIYTLGLYYHIKPLGQVSRSGGFLNDLIPPGFNPAI